MKLGTRLQTLDLMISKPYRNIWDCCCDHGQLGLTLLQRHAAEQIHFVDIVEPLISQLQKKLVKFYSTEDFKSRWQTHCLDVASLKVEDITQTSDHGSSHKQTDLIIIAGVGADQTVEFVQKTQANNLHSRLEFLLCPVLNLYKVRDELRKLEFGLGEEQIILENGRYYEGLLVSKEFPTHLSSVGSLMWNFEDPIHLDYLNKLLAHYKRKSKDKKQDVNEIIEAYQQLLEHR